MEKKHIISPRPFFEHKENPKERTLVFGTTTAGIIVKFTKQNTIKINGYYENFDGNIRYANIRDFVELSQEDLAEFWRSLKIRNPKSLSIVETPDEVDTPDQEYLDKLRIVTLNGIKFYIDPIRRERRPVSSPSYVFKFDKVLSPKST